MESNENNMAEDVLSSDQLVDVTLSSTTDPETGCEIFDGCKSEEGYGFKWIDGTLYRAHSVKWVQEKGEIPPNLFVCHKCDNPPCINIDHLFLGTHVENMEDMKKKGRQPDTKGEANPRCKISKESVNFIRLAKGIISQPRLGKIFGISRQHVSEIQRGKKWKHM